MTEKLDEIPSWIESLNNQKDRAALQAEKATKRQLEDAAIVSTRSSEFWKELVDRLGVNVKALPQLKGEELVGSISHETGPSEHRCYIGVNRQSVQHGPELSWLNLFYRPGATIIRRWYMNEDIGGIELARYGDEVRAIISGKPKTAQELADLIVRWMADRVKANRRG